MKYTDSLIYFLLFLLRRIKSETAMAKFLNTFTILSFMGLCIPTISCIFGSKFSVFLKIQFENLSTGCCQGRKARQVRKNKLNITEKCREKKKLPNCRNSSLD